MNTLTAPVRLVLQALLIAMLAAVATAQIPGPNSPQQPEPGLPGQYDIYDKDGEPLRKDADVGIDIHINPDGSYTGEVWICKDGVTTYIPGEVITFWQVGYGQYVWESAQGGTGITTWDSYYGHYRSLVTGGPHTGTERILVD